MNIKSLFTTVCFLILSPLFFSQSVLEKKIKSYDYTKLSNDLQNNLKEINLLYDQAKIQNDSLAELAALLTLYDVHFLSSDFKTALLVAQNGYKLAEQLKETSSQTRFLGNIGWTFYRMRNAQAQVYFKKAIELGEKTKSLKELAWVYDNYGVVVQNRNVDSALIFYNKSLNTKIKLNDKIGIPYSYFKIATAQMSLKQFDRAAESLNATKKYFTDKDKNCTMEYYAYLGDLFVAQQQFGNSIPPFEKSLNLAKENNIPMLIAYNVEMLAKAHEKMGDYKKAYFYKIQEKEIRDSILNSEKVNSMLNMQLKFNQEKSDRELAIKEKKEIKLDLEISKRNNYLILLILGIAIIGLSSYYMVQKTRRKRTEEKNKNELEKVQLENQFSLEKLRISRDLHDNIGAHLTFIINTLDLFAYTHTVDADRLSEIGDFSRETLNDLRSTVWALNHESGTIEQLIDRIDNLKKYISVPIQIQCNQPDFNLIGMHLLHLYRIIQEFTQNTVKYAEASNIFIQFTVDKKMLTMVLKDDGSGFNRDKIDRGNGLANMKQRAIEIDGEYSISSDKNGTQVTVTVNYADNHK